MRAVIFGASGQDGCYLTDLLRKNMHEVVSIGRNDEISITELNSVARLVRDIKPDFIFHLAANSTTSHNALFENHAVIATGTLNILESVKNYSPGTKVFISGSGLQFQNNNLPLKETDPFEARDPYSVSRIQSVYAARYFRSLGIKTYVGYFFNHDSPLRTERHMTQKIAAFAKRIAAGAKEKLQIGDLSAIKEYGFAGDIVKGIWTLVNQDSVTEANISTGMGYSVKDWVDECFKITGRDWKTFIEETPGYISPYKVLVSDPSRIMSLGWKPEVRFSELAAMMMQ